MAAFSGQIATVRCHEDNVLVKRRAGEPGRGRVLVVDGGGSQRVALVGEAVAGAARESGWAGLVLHASVRDTAALRGLDLGIKAAAPARAPATRSGTARSTSP